MPAEPILLDPPDRLWRVERQETQLHYSRITAEHAEFDNAGNRFDVLGAGVLYAASSPQGAYAETTAHLRRSASLIARMRKAGATADELIETGIDAAWRSRRVLRTLRTRDALPFVDIEHPATHTYLTEHAAEVLLRTGVQALDVALARGPSRQLTRGLASWLYSARGADDALLYGGIRYVSRLGDYECWAIFDGTTAEVLTTTPIVADDADLVAVAALHGVPLE